MMKMRTLSPRVLLLVVAGEAKRPGRGGGWEFVGDSSALSSPSRFFFAIEGD